MQGFPYSQDNFLTNTREKGMHVQTVSHSRLVNSFRIWNVAVTAELVTSDKLHQGWG